MTAKADPATAPSAASSARPGRPQNSRFESTATLGSPSGPIGEEAAEYLEEFVGTHQHHHDEGTSAGQRGEEMYEVERRKALPWWRRPSPWWLLCAVPFSSLAKTASLAPRVELYTMLACRVHKPDIFYDSHATNNTSIMGKMGLSESEVDTFSPTLQHAISPASQIPMLTTETHSVAKPSSPCGSDPTVLAAVARLSAVTETTMGVLSLLTTGWWGAFADRHGRATILGISVLGLLITDFSIIFVYYFSEHLPGNYWFIMVGSVLEGLVGGFSTSVAAQHAYISETSTDASRARFLSLGLGLMFSGVAIGPTVGSVLIRATEQLISVFYLTLAVHLFYAVLIFIGLPEPLSESRMKQSQRKYAEELRVDAEEQATNGAPGWRVRARRLFRFLSPLSIFMPDFVVEGEANPLKKKEKDWSLALLAVAYGCTISLIASAPYLFQYATATFGWTTETLGYWLSLVGAGRAIWLTVVLPICIKIFKPKPIIIEIPASSPSRTAVSGEEEPLLSSGASDEAASERRETIRKELHSPRFELGVARLSLILEVPAYGLMVLFASQDAFAVYSVLGAMGVGFSPAVQTLALAMYARRGGTETGRLFGALSVVQALAGQILGPAIYGFIFIRTVVIFPRAIFVAGFVCVTLSLILLSFIRLPPDRELEKELLGVAHRGDLEEIAPGTANTSNS
ncbi:hypothetical protein D9611_005020 [Ephemerocybe angulata]|uniref:MFS general substrate transporter n=1 Tax=Ephemerocybe angulata TaxID=980116 RepID=A0A8H5B3A9_9AGAR|nr:hypothetical protein D9611_005020 [Tulosesus angulatus]